MKASVDSSLLQMHCLGQLPSILVEKAILRIPLIALNSGSQLYLGWALNILLMSTPVGQMGISQS